MTPLDSILSDFNSDLQRAEHLLRLIKEFRKFAGSLVPEELQNDDVSWPEAIILANEAPRVRTDLPILSGSILLYICGRFECFVREVVTFLADEMAAKVSSYAELSDTVRKELRNKTLEAAQNPGRFGYNEEESDQLIIMLAGNLNASVTAGSVNISSRLLSVTDSNMNPRMVAEIFKRVDITDVWGDLSKQAELKAHLSKRGDKECKAEATSRLDAMMKERNSVAHPTGVISFPDPDQVLESSGFLKVLSQVIIHLARVPR